MEDWINILEYRDFYDVPRVFMVCFQAKLFLFDCPFDEGIDDYPDEYEVFELPHDFTEHAPSDWRRIQSFASKHLGTVRLNEIEFDETRREAVRAGIFRQIRKGTTHK